MTLSEFKGQIIFRSKLLKASTLFSFKEATAYAGNNYGNMMSTIIYTATYLVFIGAMFNKVKLIAGYSYSEVLLLMLMTQISFYLIWSFSISNIDLLSKNVKSGDLDLWITRPVPLLWFVTFQKININSLIVDATPAMTPLLILIYNNWDYQLTTTGVIGGAIIMLMGVIISHCFQFILNLSCFWTGENQNMRNLAFEMTFFGDSIPYEGYTNVFRNIGMFLIPSIITTTLSTSFMLGKTTSPLTIPIVFGIMILFLWLNSKMWNLALKHYSSASS